MAISSSACPFPESWTPERRPSLYFGGKPRRMKRCWSALCWAHSCALHAGHTIAITGGDLMAALDGQVVPTYRAVTVQAGQTLRFQAPKTGCRAYIAFAGGLDIPEVMGSRSTYLKAKIGGLGGRKLQKDDVIGFRAPGIPKNLSERYIYPEFIHTPCTPCG